jgi:DNA-binding HxlR family transcriptional regulator
VATTTVKNDEPRSYCPVNLSVEIFGDRWTLLIIRDMVFAGKRHFREMLQSDERISSNILADRLKMLLEHGLITKTDDPSHKQKAVYSLTEKGISLFPVFVQIGAWGRRFLPASKQLAARSRALEEGGPPLWNRLMAELRESHLGVRTPTRKSRTRSIAKARVMHG